MAEQEFKHIVRVMNTDLKGEKPIAQALLRIRGVGVSISNAVCSKAKLSRRARTGDLSDAQIQQLNSILSNPQEYNIPSWMFNRRRDPETGEDRHVITGDLKYSQENDIRQLKKIKAYRGMRHAFGLPVRGQRTKSNFTKNKGKVTGVKKKKEEAPAAKK